MNPESAFLFIPADDEAAARDAAASGADVVILDLEDLLPPPRKQPAREGLAALLAIRPARQRWLVRVNPLDASFAFEDVAAAVREGVAGIMAPKIERGEEVAALGWALAGFERRAGLPVGGMEVICIIESAAAFLNLPSFARTWDRPVRLGLGTGDLGKDLGLRPTDDETEIAYFRSALVSASRAAGLPPPIDCVWLNVGDEAGLARATARGRGFGLRGKFCLSPAQAAIVREASTPSAADLETALAVLAAYETAQGRGEASVVVRGEFVDEPIAQRYRSTLANADRRVARSDDGPS